MKLSRSLDLAPIRAAAYAEIDADAERLAADRAQGSAAPTLHREKAALARAHLAGAPPHRSLALEAQEEGVDVGALARRIVARSEAMTDRLMAIDAERRARKRNVAAASNEQDIRAVLSTL